MEAFIQAMLENNLRWKEHLGLVLRRCWHSCPSRYHVWVLVPSRFSKSIGAGSSFPMVHMSLISFPKPVDDVGSPPPSPVDKLFLLVTLYEISQRGSKNQEGRISRGTWYCTRFASKDRFGDKRDPQYKWANHSQEATFCRIRVPKGVKPLQE